MAGQKRISKEGEREVTVCWLAQMLPASSGGEKISVHWSTQRAKTPTVFHLVTNDLHY
jgi:hypothetical protein